MLYPKKNPRFEHVIIVYVDSQKLMQKSNNKSMHYFTLRSMNQDFKVGGQNSKSRKVQDN